MLRLIRNCWTRAVRECGATADPDGRSNDSQSDVNSEADDTEVAADVQHVEYVPPEDTKCCDFADNTCDCDHKWKISMVESNEEWEDY